MVVPRRIVIYSGSRDLLTLPNANPLDKIYLHGFSARVGVFGDFQAQHIKVVQGYNGNLDIAADKMADYYGMQKERYPYPQGMGKAGGPVRNQAMIMDSVSLARKLGIVVVGLCFFQKDYDCRGTSDFAEQFLHMRKNGNSKYMDFHSWTS